MNNRVPPHNIEAEQAVLGAIFLDPEVFSTAAERLHASDFYRANHEAIFEAMFHLAENGEPIDIVTVTTYLQNVNKLDVAGGVPYITDLASSVPTAANIDYYSKIVEEKALLRRLIQTATDIVTQSFNREDNVEELLDEAERNILEVANKKNTTMFKSIKDVLIDVYENIEQLHQAQGEVTGVPTGYRDLDRITSGFQKNDLIIIAARPSMGKTAFALNIAQNVAINSDHNVAIFSLEMGAEQLVQRMLCAEGNIDSQRLRTGNLEQEDWGKLTMAMGSLSHAGIFIDDSPSVRVADIRAKCRRLAQEHGLGMIIIDYLQLIQGSENAKENRQQEVSEISRSLKSLARELEVPLIALSQLSRSVESRQDKRPMMSDLRESGSIEQDADIVGFLYRDDYYNQEVEEQNIEIIISKQRNGPTGTVELAFVKEYNKFVDLDFRYKESEIPPPQMA
ncbi:MAG TPA: replicative DNA helicase [Pseudogracilibacillus sp.]|nr:replicative DNA helicase [Pseudogracilibacillus sp.]